MDAYQSSEACGQRADAEPKQNKAGGEYLSDYQNRSEDDPEDPDVVFHSALKSATKRHKMHKRKVHFAGLFPCFFSFCLLCLFVARFLLPKILQNKPDVCRPLRQTAHEIRIPAFAIRHIDAHS